MFPRVHNFLSRHKGKFIVTGLVVGGGVLAVQYAQRKLREYQEAQATEFFERNQRLQHFEDVERTCNQTVMSLGKNLCDAIAREIDVNAVIEQLRTNPENKVALWQEMKILSFTQLTTLVYATSMLVVTLRVQFNILAAYMYRDQCSETKVLAESDRQAYLAYVQTLLGEGIVQLARLIETQVRRVVSESELTQPFTLAAVEQLFWSIQHAVNNEARNPNSHLAKYVMPNDVHETEVLQKIYTETLDMLESDDVIALNTNNVSRGFSVVVDKIADFYAAKEEARITELSPQAHCSTASDGAVSNYKIGEASLPLAKLIPIVSGLSSKPFGHTKPTSLAYSLVTMFMLCDKTKMLGLNVYETFSQ